MRMIKVMCVTMYTCICGQDEGDEVGDGVMRMKVLSVSLIKVMCVTRMRMEGF